MAHPSASATPNPSAPGAGSRIAYQGITGAFSEQAALQFAPDGEAIGFPSFEEAFDAVLKGTADYACLPVENSLAGSINQTYDLLTNSVLHVVGEQIVRVHHNLLAKPGVALDDVKRVYSHPQALAQCAAFIRKHHFEAITDFDTAGAAKLLAENGNSDSSHRAAIASKRAADTYGLAVLAEHIEDMPFNFTRFLVLGQDEAVADDRPHKSSLVLATRHRPGDLVACLEQFRDNGVNMTKLESRPRRDKPWSYVFYIDIEGHIDEANVAAAITGLMRKAAFVKFLGSYPAAPALVDLE